MKTIPYLMVTSMLRGHAALRSELARLKNRLQRIARADRVVRLMITVPGVGTVVALQVKAGIDDPTRFQSSKNVGTVAVWCRGACSPVNAMWWERSAVAETGTSAPPCSKR